MKLNRLFSAAMLTVLSCTVLQAASINEIRVDQPGGDDDEFVELFGAPGESLDDLSFVILQDNGSIDGIVDLDGENLNANGFFVIAESTFTIGTADLTATLNLENGENSTYLLVQDLSGMQMDDLDADDDGVLETMPWTAIIDGVSSIDDEDTVLDGGPEDINYGPSLGLPVVGPDGTFLPGTFAAIPDGSDNYVPLAFSTDDEENTPGATNGIPEPASVVLFGLAMACASVTRRK